jgi:hypothetical protein
LNSDRSIRWVGITDQDGIIINERDREGLNPLLTIEENHDFAVNTITRHKTRLKLESKIGELTYTFRRYTRMSRCLIPINNENYYLILKLDFDANACSYLLLQMNQIQNLFVFQIIIPNTDIILPIMPIKENIDIHWFEIIANKILNDRKRSAQKFDERVVLAGNDKIIRSEKHKIDFCIGIISERIVIKNQKNDELLSDKYFMTIGNERSYPVSLISSYLWDRNYSPPSLFEYLINSVLISTLFSTFLYFDYRLNFHVTESSGCIFDITGRKSDRKILVSNSNICPLCESKIKELERKINPEKVDTSLYDIIKKILAMDWIGDITKRNTPLYNLQRNYGYNVDRNSGFNKKWWEKIRDNIFENFPQLIVGGIIGVGMTVLGTLLASIFRMG